MGHGPPGEEFWRRIPSAKLYLVADKVINSKFELRPPDGHSVSR